MNLPTFDKLAHHLFSIFVTLQTHLEGDLFGIKVGILVSITSSLSVVLKHPRCWRAIGSCVICPALLLCFKLFKLSLHRHAHLILNVVLVGGTLPTGRIIALSPLLLLVHVVGVD